MYHLLQDRDIVLFRGKDTLSGDAIPSNLIYPPSAKGSDIKGYAPMEANFSFRVDPFWASCASGKKKNAVHLVKMAEILLRV